MKKEDYRLLQDLTDQLDDELDRCFSRLYPNAKSHSLSIISLNSDHVHVDVEYFSWGCTTKEDIEIPIKSFLDETKEKYWQELEKKNKLLEQNRTKQEKLDELQKLQDQVKKLQKELGIK